MESLVDALMDGILDPYWDTLDLSTYEHIKLYNKAIIGLPESDRYNFTRSKWTDFYQKLEDVVSIFEFKSEVLTVSSRDIGHAPTEFKNIILLYPSITKIMVDSHCEFLWDDNYVANLGRHPTEN